MREAQLEGLRAAARVAFSMTVLGCGGSRPPEDAPAIAVAPPLAPPSTATPAARETADCQTIIVAAFPTAGTYPGTKQEVGAEVEQCCVELLREVGNHFDRAWDCCAQVESRWKDVQTACTPWGPPTPPALEARDLDRWRWSPIDLRADASREREGLDLRVEASSLLGRSALATWHARMLNEHASARVFDALGAQLREAGLADAAREASSFADEERRHGVLCGAVVEALGGHAIGEERVDDAFPLHLDAATPVEAALRNVLSIACLSETVAVALIGAERAAMPEGPLRDLLGRIWADEIGHARFGWKLLDRVAPTLDPAARGRLCDYLRRAIDHLVTHELEHLPATFEPPSGGAALGLCSGTEARALFEATLETVLLPALARRGLRASEPVGTAHSPPTRRLLERKCHFA